MTVSSSPPLIASKLRPFLRNCGYRDSLLRAACSGDDGRQVGLVGFAHVPADARTACVAAIDADGDPSRAAKNCRLVGAPVVFTCHNGDLQWWNQRPEGPELVESVPGPKVPAFFEKKKHDLAPAAVYRAKTWGRFDAEYRLKFVDLGLMPLVEDQVGRSLEELIVRQVGHVKSVLQWNDVSEADGQWLLQCVFWLVSAKILKDKGVLKFSDLSFLDVDDVFQRLASHYGTIGISISSRRKREALLSAAQMISQFSDLGLATTESLSYVYENTLISKETRLTLGTHSTPSYLVDYVVGKLAHWIQQIEPAHRYVFEPACGHAAFLVSSMRLLTELLPEDQSSPAQRRRYLRPRLHGCDLDPFALEIARLSLTLTDVPNHDGWALHPSDMFTDPSLLHQARKATVLLANPPFEDFSSREQKRYERHGCRLMFKNKTAELLGRILPALPMGAVLGIIVPRGILVNKDVARLREQLVTQFELLEICQFPDKVFTFSDSESAVILARKRRPTRQSVRHRRIRESELAEFRRSYQATAESEVLQSHFAESYGWNLNVPDLIAVWEACRAHKNLESIAQVGNGFNFFGKQKLPPGAKTVSVTRFPGAKRGFDEFDCDSIHSLPTEKWLNLASDVVASARKGTDVGIPQVLLNYGAGGRSPWRLRALLDKVGHAVTTRFLVVRPKRSMIPLEFLWALLNSPVANAFAYDHLGKRDNTLRVINELPVPDATDEDVTRVVAAANEYLNVVVTPLFAPKPSASNAMRLLRRMDCEVLRLYRLPVVLERRLLDLFGGVRRKGVPFEFTGYVPKSFDASVGLMEFLAITDGWAETNLRRCELIQRTVDGGLTGLEKTELESLQRLADMRVRLLAPLSLDELRVLKRQTVGESS